MSSLKRLYTFPSVAEGVIGASVIGVDVVVVVVVGDSVVVEVVVFVICALIEDEDEVIMMTRRVMNVIHSTRNNF